MGKKEFEASLAEGGAHHRLAQMAGEWAGTFRLWFQPDQLACESPQRGSIRSILGGRFLLHEYQTRFGDDLIDGVALYGVHLDDDAFESAWVESFGTGTSIMFSAGSAGAEHFNVLGSYGDGQGGPRWDWRTEIEQPDADHLVITMTNITPQGEAAKAVEVRYARVHA
ncbi:DUF1579 domain-containing protein [Lysobacter cavernae]|uniref:DUF1579 domain-containing protein n=1 Tax=Lysobacter cavernae TaxID=1685901 RepID=A0ABV7RJK8_9GAMM